MPSLGEQLAVTERQSLRQRRDIIIAEMDRLQGQLNDIDVQIADLDNDIAHLAGRRANPGPP